MKNALKKYLILIALFMVGLSGVANATPLDAYEIVKAMPLVFIAHVNGHIEYGNHKGYGIDVDISKGSESFDAIVSYPIRPRILRAQAYISGGGFAYQDSVLKATGQPEIIAANAIYKASYLLGSYKLLSDGNGDLGSMKSAKGNDAYAIMLGSIMLSTVSDALRLNGYMPDADISFIVFDTGAPGMMYTKRF